MEILNEFKIIWKYLKKYKKEVYKIYFFALINSIILAFIPFLFGKLIDLVKVGPDELTLIFGILIIWFLMSLISVFLTKKVSQRGDFLGVDLSTDLVYKTSIHIIKLPISFHRHKKIGEIYSKVERAASHLFEITAYIFFWILPQFLTVIIALFILFSVQWQLALGLLFILFAYILITLYKTKPIIGSQEKFNKIAERVSGNLCDIMLNVQTIKSCAAEEFQRQKIKNDYKEKKNFAFKNLLNSWVILEFWQKTFFAFGFMGLFVMAIFLLRAELITVGILVMFLGYLNLVRAPLQSLSWHWQRFKIGITTIKRVEQILKMPTENYRKEGRILKEMQGKVEFKNVSFKYDKKDKQVLENINFVVQSGEVIALIGGSGEGKTTLVDLISLYFKPSQGEILIDDVNIEKLNLLFLREKIAYVFQEIILFNDTIKNNIRLGKPEASDEEVIESAKSANAHQFIENFPDKYNQIVGERGIKLSTGQKQRIAIARALIRDAKILILDEATSALDSESERLVQESLEKLMKNRTTFIIAHRLSTIRKADRILVLEGGKIIEQGNHQELINKKGAYFKFYSLQKNKELF